jgi:hypothetical protein
MSDDEQEAAGVRMRRIPARATMPRAAAATSARRGCARWAVPIEVRAAA